MLETYVIHLTKKCNMKCTYCYESDKTSEYTWYEVKNVLDNIIKYNKHFNIEFLGGEPCLRIDLIIEVVHYLSSMSDVSVDKFVITTNGTIIDDKLINLMNSDRRVVWAASLDGHSLANFMRITKDGVNSYNTVIENFHKLQDEVGDDTRQLGVHMVTHPYNIGYIEDSISVLYKEGIRFFDIGIVENTIQIGDDFCHDFCRVFKSVSDNLKAGKWAGATITLFNNHPSKPNKHYVRDESGKVIFETFGRVENDVKDSVDFKTDPSESRSGLSELIYTIKKEVYDYHNR